MKTISIPVNNRPEHLKRVLDSIAAAEGHEEWLVVFSCEPGTAIPTFKSSLISVNMFKRGCWVNTFLAADLAMTFGSTLNLYLEDDYLLAPDALTLVSQWNVSGKIGVLCLRRAQDRQDVNRPADVSAERSGLFGCGFAWRGPVWACVREAWFGRDFENKYRMWDHSIAEGLRDVPQWRPMVNRSFGIGLNGTHSKNAGKDLNLFGPAYDGPPVKEFHFV